MPSHRAPKLSPRKASAVALVGVAAGSTLLMQGSAHAETLSQAKADYNTKMQQSEVATEAYNAANEQAATLQAKVNSLQAQISTATAEMSSLQRTMGLQAAQQYENAGMSSTLELALESSPETYLNKALASNEISQKEAQLLKQLATDKAQIAADQKLAQTELAQQQAAVATAQKQKTAALAAASQAKSVISTLSAAQQATITSGGGSTTNTVKVVASNSRAATAVAYAESKLGDSYVYAASGPSTFDCSGLTMAAWAAAGVTLPHNAAEQMSVTQSVSESQAQPGDLVFFYDGPGYVGHVGIYLGNGMLIDAPHTGAWVREISLSNIGMQVAGFGRV
ncbi:C40 family peptidase [Actinospica sp. MGRD01-02]|uniref:C40 family peptidase n=1 Tax=Actinospica acidithermotolerans TaxID=2828514 RepID=A0A941EC32_9ACTN|nr:NlpC/P60 family protein [Actinospica acidithermotolerans]MBR7826284.1 C40 family peptidase [Actinospica acidithermotolerans]